jgi:hypothetical protein
MPLLATPTTIVPVVYSLPGRRIDYYRGIISETIATPSSWSGSICPFGASRLWTAIHADANPGATTVVAARFRTLGRGVGGDFTSWMADDGAGAGTPDSLGDLNLLRESQPTNSAAGKGTDTVGGPVIQEIGYAAPSGIQQFEGTVLIEEIQFQIVGHTGTRVLRLDVYVEYPGRA